MFQTKVSNVQKSNGLKWHCLQQTSPKYTSLDKVEQTFNSIQGTYRKTVDRPNIYYSFQWENLQNDEVTPVKNHPLRAYSIYNCVFMHRSQKTGCQQ